MLILPLRPPLHERHPCKLNRLAIRSPIEIVIEEEFFIPPLRAQQWAGFPIDDVVLECERPMRLHARSLNLLLFGEREDVIADNVLLAVMLMESAGLRVVNDIVLRGHSARPLIEINSPPAVIERL